MGILQGVLANLAGPLRDQVRRGLHGSSIKAELGGSLREIRDTTEVTKEAMAGVISAPWLEWGQRAEGSLALTPQEAEMLSVHAAVTTNWS